MASGLFLSRKIGTIAVLLDLIKNILLLDVRFYG
jgi:hypothetical protein